MMFRKLFGISPAAPLTPALSHKGRGSAVLVVAGILALAAYFFVPPPQGAQAFEAQSTWGGTGGGSANAQTVTIHNVQSLNDVLGVPLRYVPAADNTGPATIAINGLTATAVRRPSNIGLVALSGGELQAGVTMTMMYNGSTIEIQGPLDMTPIGKSVEYRGSAALRGTLIEDGSCVSRTTYAPLFSVIGTNYGACDGTTTFGVPDSRGTGFVALDGQGANGLAGRITTASCATPNAVGLCGRETHTNLLSELPTGIASTVSLTLLGAGYVYQGNGVFNLGVNVQAGGSGSFVPATISGGWAQSGSPISGTAISNNTSGAAHPILNPILLGRRAIKF